MKDKKKQIEEMAKDLCIAFQLASAGTKTFGAVAEILADKWQPKLPEDSFVLTNDNAEEIGNLIVTSPQMQFVMSNLIRAWQKETAKEIFAELFYIASIHHSDVTNILAWAEDKAKQLGVKIKE